MVFRVAVDGIDHTTETDRDIRYAIIGRVPDARPGQATVEDSDSGLGRRIDPGISPGSGPGGTSPLMGVRQVLGWCATRDEAEASLQKLFSENVFSDLEIVPVARK